MWQRAGLTEPSVKELDGVDGVGAGAVENLLAAGCSGGYDHNRDGRILHRNARGPGKQGGSSGR